MDKFQDVEFEAVDNNSNEKTIRGSVLYYNTSQVADILGITDSKVRYYSKVFDNILNIEVINKQRKYKQSDIDKLKYMCELKEEGLSIKQIEQYCSEVSFEEDGKVQVKESNPLSIKALSQMLMKHQEEQIIAMEGRIINKLENYIQAQENNNTEIIEKVKEEISITVDEVVSEKLENHLEKTIEENKVIKEELAEHKKMLEEIKNTAYVSMEEIKKQKQEPPNRWFKRFMGWK